MARLIAVPPERLEADTLQNLLEEFASRDGTDYGARETPLAERVARLRQQLGAREIRLLFDLDSEHWDLLSAEQARVLLDESSVVVP